jgi:HAD superfamily hydrolase (TIGR01509 family)
MDDNISILFDLDGTLLPMDYDRFTKAYFKELSRKMAPLGYEASELVSGIWSGVNAILQGDPNTTGEERFWTEFARIFGPRVYEDKAIIDDFYTHEFHNASIVTHRTPLARAAVDLAHQKGAKVVLATNPIFPLCAVHSRLQWAGLTPEDFDLITSYETSHYCKPDPRYYGEILEKLGLTPSRCLMIGNDVGEDIQSAQSLGLATFLIEDCILGDPTEVTTPSGTFEDCIHFLENLPDKN